MMSSRIVKPGLALLFLLAVSFALDVPLTHPTSAEGPNGCFSGNPNNVIDGSVGDTSTSCGIISNYHVNALTGSIVANPIKNMTVQVVIFNPSNGVNLHVAIKNSTGSFVAIFDNNGNVGSPTAFTILIPSNPYTINLDPNQFVISQQIQFNLSSSTSNFGQTIYDIAVGFDYATKPSTPWNLTNNSMTNDSYFFSWNASNSTNFGYIVNYSIYKNDVFLTNTSNSTFSYNATGLSYDTDYNFSVTALDVIATMESNKATITFRTANHNISANFTYTNEIGIAAVNYSNSNDSQPILNALCNVSVWDSSTGVVYLNNVSMTYNSSSTFYEYYWKPSEQKTYNYAIGCAKPLRHSKYRASTFTPGPALPPLGNVGGGIGGGQGPTPEIDITLDPRTITDGLATNTKKSFTFNITNLANFPIDMKFTDHPKWISVPEDFVVTEQSSRLFTLTATMTGSEETAGSVYYRIEAGGVAKGKVKTDSIPFRISLFVPALSIPNFLYVTIAIVIIELGFGAARYKKIYPNLSLTLLFIVGVIYGFLLLTQVS